MTDTHRTRSPKPGIRPVPTIWRTFPPEVCRRHDLGLSALRARARRHGWRRADQPDPEIEDDDLDDYADVDLNEMVDVAWRRVARALDRGASTEAARWLRIHEALHARAQAELQTRHDEREHVAYQARVNPGHVPVFKPRLTPEGRGIHDVHYVHSKISETGPLSRAERRRREKEARRSG